QLRTRLRILSDIARILACVRRKDWLALLCGDPDNALSQHDGTLAGDPFAVARGKTMFKLLRALIPQQDAEHLEVNDTLQQLTDTLQQIVEVQNAGDLA